MDIQESYDKLIQLIERSIIDNPFCAEISDYSMNGVFRYFSYDYKGKPLNEIGISIKETINNQKLHWETEQNRDPEEGPYVIGYETLIPSLENWDSDIIGISGISTRNGSYIIFTSVDKNQLIGILKSRKTFQLNNEPIPPESLNHPQYINRQKLHIFENGVFIESV